MSVNVVTGADGVLCDDLPQVIYHYVLSVNS